MKIISLTLVVVFLMGSLTAGPAQTKEDEPEGFLPALLVIDVQNKWLPMMDEKGKDSSLGLSSAFKHTGLNKILRERKCNILFLCGLSAVGCVLATYFGGKDLD